MTDEPRPEGAGTENVADTATVGSPPPVTEEAPETAKEGKLAETVEIRDIPDAAFPMEPEVRKLRYLLESMI